MTPTGTKSRRPLAEHYERHREEMAERSAAFARAGQDIGAIPPVLNPARRRRCGRSLKLFSETYFPHVFYLKWSRDHLRVLKKAERAVREGGLFAVAMPRGSGKTSICEAAVMWSMLYGYRWFPFFIGPELGKALASLEAIKLAFQTNEALLEDFPEIIFPFQALEGISNRCRGQRFGGVLTHIRWAKDTLVVATIPGSAASGSVIRVAGITGSIRGQKHDRAEMEPLRPDLVFIDEGQTRESARSPSQVKQRLDIIQADVLKLAGPGRKIAGLMACTVIEPDDVADQILDPEKHPEWQGERISMLRSLPTRMDLWEEYSRLLQEDLRDVAAGRGPGGAAMRFFRKRRRVMELGAESFWPAMHDEDELSNVQHAMNAWAIPGQRRAFWSEYQNRPEPALEVPKDALTVDAVAKRLSGRARGVVPVWATHLVAFVDVQANVLFHAAAAFADDFTGAVVDYGTWPDQKRAHFTKSDARRTYGRAFPGRGFEGSLRGALDACVGALLQREWRREDGNTMRIERLAVDANWGDSTSTVYEFIQSHASAGMMLPSHGSRIGPAQRPWHEYEKKPGELLGHHWRIRHTQGKAIRHLVVDTYLWKSVLHARLSTAVGDRTAMTLFGREASEHLLFAEHLCAEYGVETAGRGRTVTVWQEKPHRPDNDWWDCLVGCCVLASICGAEVPGAGMQVIRARPRRRVNLNELQPQRMR